MAQSRCGPLKALEDVVNVQREPHVPKIVLPVTSVLLPPFEALPLQQSAAPQQPVATYDDQLTPRLLEALGVLDAGLEDLDYVEKSAQEAAAATARAAEEDEEPAWLRSASVNITSTSEAISSSLAASSSLAPGESTTGAQLSAVSTTLALELAREEVRIAALETQSHHLRLSAEAQARTSLEVLQQLELTRSAAQSTQAAARRIVEDHEKDIALLLSELRNLLPAQEISDIESRLSAPMEALAARRRHAAAAAAVKRRGGSAAAPSASNVPRSMSFDRFKKVAADAVADLPSFNAVVTRARASSPFRGRR